MAKNISTQIVETLKSIGVKRIYGIPGDSIDTLMESIRADKEMDFIVARHEANAGFMASGEARITGNIAVAVACQGPGANNLLNGLADAAGDGIPVLAITGQIDNDFIGTKMPQGSNQLQLFEDITCFNAEARSPQNLIETLHIAINAALQGGVAHISVPANVMKAAAVPSKTFSPVYKNKAALHPNETNLQQAADAINRADKIAILYGDGGRDAADAIVALSEKLNAPLIHTTRSKDVIDNTHPHMMGGIGIMGSHPANEALHACDLLLIIGSNYAYKSFYPDAIIVKIDCNSTHLATHVEVDHPIHADAKIATEKLLDMITPKTYKHFLESFKQSLLKHLDTSLYLHNKTKDSNPIHPGAVISETMQYLKEDGIICGDSGTSTIWINNIARFNGKQRFLWSANLASLGAAFGQGLGASMAVGKKEVIVIAGDGGFQFSINDLVTAAMYRVPLKCFILNNGAYKFIEFEEATHDGNVPYGTKLLNPDYAALAEASHCKGLSADSYSTLQACVKEAFAHDGPVIVDCKVNPDALLLPPAVNAKMAYNYVKSEIKGWFSTTPEEEKRIEEIAKGWRP